MLVRDEKRAEPIKAKYPNTKFIYGSLEDEPLVENAAAEADIIIRMSMPDARNFTILTHLQTPPTHRTIPLALGLLLKASRPATRRRSLDTGSICQELPS